jgi:tryptophanyl-tRNA synthetase
MRKQIAGIVTDSKAPGEPKATEGSALFQIYQAFASAEETAALAKAYAEGIGWGDAKQILFERIDREVAPMREHYEALIKNPAELDRLLRVGAEKARSLATPFMRELRHAVGLRALSSGAAAKTASKEEKIALPSFKQYREKDGLFYFKLVSPQGQILLQSTGFASPKDAGQAIGHLQSQGAQALPGMGEMMQPIPAELSALAHQALDKIKEALSPQKEG